MLNTVVHSLNEFPALVTTFVNSNLLRKKRSRWAVVPVAVRGGVALARTNPAIAIAAAVGVGALGFFLTRYALRRRRLASGAYSQDSVVRQASEQSFPASDAPAWHGSSEGWVEGDEVSAASTSKTTSGSSKPSRPVN